MGVKNLGPQDCAPRSLTSDALAHQIHGDWLWEPQAGEAVGVFSDLHVIDAQ